jgi:hypothetical protein
MKKVLAILFLLVVVTACKKKEVNATVIITVLNDGKTVVNPTIYMKKGSTGDPTITLSAYDQTVTGNKIGQYAFENLSSDDYYFFATAAIDTLIVSGGVKSKVEVKEAPNRYELKIYTQ